MSISPIINPSPNDNPVAPQQSVHSSAQPQPAQVSAFSGQDPEDTVVDLSRISQIVQMAQQGESVGTIANSTGFPVSEIDSDLGIVSSNSNAPVAVPSGHGGGHASAPVPPSSAAAAPAAVASVPKTATTAHALSVEG